MGKMANKPIDVQPVNRKCSCPMNCLENKVAENAKTEDSMNDQVPILSVVYFAAKVIFMLFFFVWVRASLPRVRYDKSMAFNWKFLMPLGLANLAVTAVVLTFLP